MDSDIGIWVGIIYITIRRINNFNFIIIISIFSKTERAMKNYIFYFRFSFARRIVPLLFVI